MTIVSEYDREIRSPSFSMKLPSVISLKKYIKPSEFPNFTKKQLQDSNISSADGILRKCVHCGFCNATCPTYQIVGDELDGPRGRIYLIKDMLENDKPANEKITKHIDRCLSCYSCMTTCPSGVNYMHLVDHARNHIEKTFTRPFFDRLIRSP